MRNRLAKAMLSGAVLLVVTGCSNSEAGTPTAAGTTTARTGGGSEPSGKPTGSGSADRHGAPPVNNSLDATRYLTDPCAAISPRLLQSLGLPVQGEPDTDVAGSCSWRAEASGVGVSFRDGRTGLADLYQRQKRGFWAYWEETTVEGYPAVFADIDDGRGSGRCVLTVAPSDPVTFHVVEVDRLKERSCDRAMQVAVAVVQTMRGDG